MNNAKLWLVVKPTVGIPLFLSAVVIGSTVVHLGVVMNTDYVEAFQAGETIAAVESNTNVAKATSIIDQAVSDASVREATITFDDGRTARITIDPASPSSKTLAAINE
jgi:light-harvesting protein B-800-850 alpha chain